MKKDDIDINIKEDNNEYSLINKFQKLKLTKELVNNKKNIILILSGSFNPIHNNHIKLLEIAKNYFNNEINNYNVLCGIIIIKPDSMIITKINNSNKENKEDGIRKRR
jgi:hypothetical protein